MVRLRQPKGRFRIASQAFSGVSQSQSGSVAVIFGLSATVLLGLAGGGIDYTRLVARRSQLQNAADSAVLAAGNTLKLALSNAASVTGVVEETVRSELKLAPEAPLAIQVTVADDKTSVRVNIEENVKLSFGGFVGMPSVKVALNAKASVVGRMRLCMLTLDPQAPATFALEKNAQVTATDYTLYANSANAKGMSGKDSAYARAQTICAAGGFDGARANFVPPPQTGCPAIADPLKDRPAPTIEACRSIPVSANKNGDTSKNEINQSVTLDPGTYCGGLKIKDSAVVTLRAGIYVMKDGPLSVEKKASLSGTDVGFYFMGNKAGLLFAKDTTISLAAPTTGAMAGLLMMEERTVSSPEDPAEAAELDLVVPVKPTPPPAGATKAMRTYRIISDNARMMLGMIYLPAGRLVIDASKPVADQSAYTVIVAQQVNLYEGPNLVLNANYSATSVPVPKGVGPLAGRLLLSQ